MHERKQEDFLGWGGFKIEGTTVQCGRKFVGSATVTAHLKPDVGCGFSNSTHFVGKIAAVLRTQTCGPFEVLPPEQKKRKKKRTFVVSGGGGGFVRTPPPPPAYGPGTFCNQTPTLWRIVRSLLTRTGGCCLLYIWQVFHSEQSLFSSSESPVLFQALVIGQSPKIHSNIRQ